MRRLIALMLVCVMVTGLAACNKANDKESGAQAESSTTASIEATTEAPLTQNPEGDLDLRSTAEGYVGKSCPELVEAIGDCISIHPVADPDANGIYHGYLHYDDFEVEFESADEKYLESGDLSGCTVTAIVDTMFDE